MRCNTTPDDRQIRVSIGLGGNGLRRGTIPYVPRHHGETIAGRRGTVIWCRPAWCDPRTGWKEWAYCVSFSVPETCLAFLESDLLPTGEIDTPESQFGQRFEISYDTDSDDDSAILEGFYRLPSQFWQVFTIYQGRVPQLAHRFTTWECGITGVVMEITKETTIDFGLVEMSMSLVFGATTWERVSGPDSGFLKCYFENDNPLYENANPDRRTIRKFEPLRPCYATAADDDLSMDDRDIGRRTGDSWDRRRHATEAAAGALPVARTAIFGAGDNVLGVYDAC